MNRLPEKKKPGDPVLAADWNTLLDAISARTPRPGTGLELIASSGGFAYSQPEGALIPRQSLPPFAVIGITKEEGKYKVVIKEGWVIERKPKSEDTPTVKFHMPKSGSGEEGTTLDTIPRPKIGMSIGDTLWCKYETDIMGEITEDPEVIVSSDDKDGTHYQPEDPEESGQDGTYYVKLLKLEDDGGTPKVKVYQQSDIEHWAQLWTGENLGSGAGVYKRHADDQNIFKFRTILGDYGIREDEAEDEVLLDFWGENIGEEDGGEVYKEPEDEDGEPIEDPTDGPAQFRKVVGRGYYADDNPDAGTTEQIKVVTDDEVVRVLGNGRVGAITLDEDGSETVLLKANDGLAEEIPDTTIYVREFKVCVDGYPETKRFLTLD